MVTFDYLPEFERRAEVLAKKKISALFQAITPKSARYERVPFLQRELTDQYDLGGDGKAYWHVNDELRVLLTRK